jgi:hypothetical protein
MIACGGPSEGAEPPGEAQPPSSPEPSSDPQPSPDPQPPGSGPTARASGIFVAFKLDPRLRGGGTYGGDVWVSPSVYVGAVGQDTVEARARFVDTGGHSTTINPSWSPSDPAMLTVSPDQGDQVTIIVNRTGESHLNVTAGGTSKALLFKASAVDGAVTQVQIFQ